MKRTKTLQDLADTLSKELFGGTLSEAHEKGVCVQCGKKMDDFPNDESRIEWEISGLCTICQKEFFDE